MFAIDGVAPRSKMKQQRSGRFMKAMESKIAEEEEERLRRSFEREGKLVLPKEESEISDSNVITPGTEFMFNSSKKLQMFIVSRMETHPGWIALKVILSDANVPGEGEHKIMAFIREQRALPDYDPNTRHCLYGMDADLIMLALATHEVHFSILRETVFQQEQQSVNVSGLQSSLCKAEAMFHQSRGGFVEDQKAITYKPAWIIKPHQFLQVWILREYLEIDLKIFDVPDNFAFDIDRLIDDFIFICLFVGNDFLPRMPTLEIHEGAMVLLMKVYKEQFKNLGGYLVDMQKVKEKKNRFIKLKRVEKFLLAVGCYEEKIFAKRSLLNEKRLKKLCQAYEPEEEDPYEVDRGGNSCSIPDENVRNSSESILEENSKELKAKLKANLQRKSDLFKNGNYTVDKVKWGNSGWKERYYKVKFSAEGPSEMNSIRKQIVQKYVEGLLWVLQYYFAGVPSWSWFYPFYYGPFVSDLKGLSQIDVNFQKGAPFKPLDQLMAVLPPSSAHALPKAYAALMAGEDSNIIDFYPTKFVIDTDGKRYSWQCVSQLPFVDEERLLAETRKLEKELKHGELERNVEDLDKLFIRTRLSDVQVSVDLLSCRAMESLSIGSCVSCVIFKLLNKSEHLSRVLKGTRFPPKLITEDDVEETPLWHESTVTRPPRTFQSHERHHRPQGCWLAGRGRSIARSHSSSEWSTSRGRTNVGRR